MKPEPPVPQAECRFFASRITFERHPEATKIAAYFPTSLPLYEESPTAPSPFASPAQLTTKVQ